jgi:predicted kinase
MIHLIVGNTGAGKSTYASALKNDSGGVIFSIDQWNTSLFFPDKGSEDGLDWFLERIERAESVIMNLVKQLEEAGVDSILDLGLSKFSHREKFRKFAAGNDFGIKIHFLDIPGETRWERILQRNRSRGDTFEFEVGREDFDFMEGWFEKPTDSEMVGGVMIQGE